MMMRARSKVSRGREMKGRCGGGVKQCSRGSIVVECASRSCVDVVVWVGDEPGWSER